MLRQTFDLQKPKQVVIYARMSSDKQNPRSPDQQIETIKGLIERMKLPWTVVHIYRDEGVSGRYVAKRAQLKAMLHDLKSGAIEAELVVVDTFVRLSRADNANLRGKLRALGVLVVTADSGFQDPTSPAGEALAFIEGMRSTEDGRVKAHNVLRGKRDAVRQRRWPGSTPPLGYRLKAILVDRNGASEFSHNVLEVDPNTAWIVRRMFQLASEHGWGTTRIAKHLNADPEIPDPLKPFQAGTIGSMLDREVYYGELVYGKHCTGIVNDVRKVQPLAEDQWQRVPDFCEPLVTRDVWDAVKAMRTRRAEHTKRSRMMPEGVPTAQGISLKYLLAGLVICGSCGRAMAPVSGPSYQTKAGIRRRYTKYACPMCASGACNNAVRVPEEWLRATVIDMLSQRLFSEPGALGQSAVFDELVHLVQAELAKLQAAKPDRADALVAERSQLQNQQAGWLQSLGSTQLAAETRAAIERTYAEAGQRIAQIGNELASDEYVKAQIATTVTPERVAAALASLASILASQNVAAGNVLLAQHVEGIYCYADRVCVRTCKLGPLAEIIELIAPRISGAPAAGTPADRAPTTGRLRSRRDLRDGFEDEDQAEAANTFAVDPQRFAGLGPEWFTSTVFPIPARQPWFHEHAEAVFRRRQETRWSLGKLAKEFGVSRPTIGAAIKSFLAAHPNEVDIHLPAGGKRPKYDLAASADEARRLYESGVPKQRLAKQFGVSEPTIRRALKLAYAPEGGRIPTRREIQEPLIRRARQLFDSNVFVGEIAVAVGLSRKTTILLLEESFAREGKPLPNLRRRRADCRRGDLRDSA